MSWFAWAPAHEWHNTNQEVEFHVKYQSFYIDIFHFKGWCGWDLLKFWGWFFATGGVDGSWMSMQICDSWVVQNFCCYCIISGWSCTIDWIFNLQLQQILSLQTLVLRKSHLCLIAVISIAIGAEGGALGTRLDTDIIPASSTAIGEDEFGIHWDA